MSLLLRSSLPGAQVLEAGSLSEALHEPRATPEIVLLDLMLNGLSGLEGIGLLKRKWPGVPVVVLSSDTAPETERAALARGATAFVSKERSADTVLAAIRSALGPTTQAAPAQPGDAERPRHLTPRQCEVLELLCQGLSNKGIGHKLGLSENTVRWHVQAVLAHLGVDSRGEAAYAARRLGLVR